VSEVAAFYDSLAERAQRVAPRFSVGWTMPPNYSAVERREIFVCVRECWLLAVAKNGGHPVAARCVCESQLKTSLLRSFGYYAVSILGLKPEAILTRLLRSQSQTRNSSPAD